MLSNILRSHFVFPLIEILPPYPGKVTAAAGAALPVPISVFASLVCLSAWCVCQCLSFLTSVQCFCFLFFVF